ncbi:MAG: NUDIX hydrolase [Dehalococcoidia bacterium]|jgi:ADP-ribose pyrophosphatase|nr:NUDIX hydrolase [Dehalococcoidia bacterium]
MSDVLEPVIPVPELVESVPRLSTHLFDVVTDTLRYPDGHAIERTVVEHPGAVAIVPVDQQGRWLLVRQYRHAARSVLLEVPAGTREAGEPPEVTAARELREETGFAADSVTALGGAWAAPGFANEYMHYFLATGLRHDPLPQDEDENIGDPVAMTFDEVLVAIDDGRIEDAKTIVAAMLWLRSQTGRE